MNVEKFRKLSQRPIALDSRNRHLCLEGRCVIPAFSLGHDLS
jgi:hypothetical protein